ncbi:MAG: protein kinase [Chloroflexi bacterium]|nr:protein kinase [Chloroflexota bacterium]
MSNDTLLNGRYRLIAQQGAGGMAVIYKAVDLALGRTVAVKVLRPSLTQDRAFLDRFREEARSVANLSHPNIVTVHDFGSEGQAYYIIMEFVEGQNLKEVIKTYGALSIDRVLNLGIQICAGIGFAHRAGLVHADIKPQNVLVTKEDVVKITDFGIAQAFSDTHPGQRQDVVWGSPHYFAPEQARGEKPNPAADVYAIGIVIFEMLTGRLPYMGQTQQELALAHIRERIPLATEFNPNVPENLARIVEKVMSKDPNQRYRMADQLGHILQSYKERGRQETAPNPAIVLPPSAPTQSPNLPVPPQTLPQSTPPGAATPPPLMGTPTQPRQSPVNLPPTPVSPYNPQAVPPPLPQSMPTQRYSVAPEAPPPPSYGGQRPPAPPPAGQNPYSAQNAAYPQWNQPQQAGAPLYNSPPPPQTPADSGYYNRSPYQGERESAPGNVLDAVTIALALLAFMAVACLIPLYIAVFSALG